MSRENRFRLQEGRRAYCVTFDGLIASRTGYTWGGNGFLTDQQAQKRRDRMYAEYFLACVLDDWYIQNAPDREAGYLENAPNVVPCISQKVIGNPWAGYRQIEDGYWTFPFDHLVSSEAAWRDLLERKDVHAAIYDFYAIIRPEYLEEVDY